MVEEEWFCKLILESMAWDKRSSTSLAVTWIFCSSVNPYNIGVCIEYIIRAQ